MLLGFGIAVLFSEVRVRAAIRVRVQFSSVQFAKINGVLSAKHFRTTIQ